VPRKKREIRADYRAHGFVQLPRRGKGSHTVFKHPLVATVYTVAGADGDDAKPYDEKDVREAIQAAQAAEQAASTEEQTGKDQ
jgi:predicted RNA binding protein YcfA (HicA-like mRNA interferase family)